MEMMNPCCCCLLRSADKDLNTPYMFLGVTETFSSLLEDCFQIRYTEALGTGCGICEECAGRLRDARDFKLQVQRSRAALRAQLERALTVNEGDDLVKSETSQNDYYNAVDENIASGENNFVTSEFSQNDYYNAVDENIVSGEDNFVTSETSQNDYYNAVDENIVSGEDNFVTSETLQNDYYNAVDENIVSGEDNLVKSESSHEGDNDMIAEDIMSDAEPAVKSETSGDAASEGEAVFCVVPVETEAWAPSGPGLVSSRVREQLAMACSVRLERLQHDAMCPRTSPHQSSLTTHMRVRAEQPTERTERRDLTFGGDREMYTCDVCSQKFTQSQHLESHKLIHTSENPFTCDLCNKQFRRKSDLTAHIRKHLGSNRYKCEVCFKGFSRKSSLNRHKLIHNNTDNKPLSCHVCGREFRRKSALTIHMRLHTESYPYTSYKCVYCFKNFATINSLKLHERIDPDEKPFPCGICNKQFKQKCALSLHIRNHNRESDGLSYVISEES